MFPTEGPLVVTVRRGARLRGTIGPAAVLEEVRRLAGVNAFGEHPFACPAIYLLRVDAGTPRRFPDFRTRQAMKPDGTFELVGLPPGRWHVVVQCFVRNESGGSYHEELGGVVDLVDGQDVSLSIDLASMLPGELEGSVLHNGAPLANARLQLWPPPPDPTVDLGRSGVMVTTDAGGRFRTTIRQGGYRVSWNSSRDGQHYSNLFAGEKARVEVGKLTRQTFTLQSGRLEVQVVDAAGKPAADVVIELRDAAAKPRLTLPATDATGQATIEGEAQAFTAWVLPKRLQESKAQREFVLARAGQSDPFAEVRLPLGPVAVRVGETTRVELKLPPAWDR